MTYEGVPESGDAIDMPVATLKVSRGYLFAKEGLRQPAT